MALGSGSQLADPVVYVSSATGGRPCVEVSLSKMHTSSYFTVWRRGSAILICCNDPLHHRHHRYFCPYVNFSWIMNKVSIYLVIIDIATLSVRHTHNRCCCRSAISSCKCWPISWQLATAATACANWARLQEHTPITVWSRVLTLACHLFCDLCPWIEKRAPGGSTFSQLDKVRGHLVRGMEDRICAAVLVTDPIIPSLCCVFFLFFFY